jgi:ferric-dicitrate binding protein FerR (iron transport regulator)
MTDDIRTMERVGERVAEELGQGPSGERKAVQRRAFLAAAQRIGASRRIGQPWLVPSLVAAAAMALLVIGGAAFLMQGAAPLQFWVGEQRIAGTEGSWVQSDGAQNVPVRFRNGSRFDLGGDTAVRIVSANTEHVAVEMSRGALSADIKRSGETTWEVNAGPYQVTVLGTAFRIDWNTERSRLAVSVSRGVVHVRGGHLSEYGIRLAAGKRLVAGGRDNKVAVEAIGEGTPVSQASARVVLEHGSATADAELGTGSGKPTADAAPLGPAAKGASPAVHGSRPAAGE